MALESFLENIVIKGNAIIGTDGSGPATYTSHASIYGSATINNNVFTAPAAATNMVLVNSCSCIFNSNRFVKGATSISNYIDITGSLDQVITSNIFDSPVNPATPLLITGLTTSSVFSNNYNQTSQNLFIYALASSYTNATTSFTSTNLAIPVNTGDTWYVEFDLACRTDTTNQGSVFGINVPAGTSVIGVVTGPTDSSNSTFVSNNFNQLISQTFFSGTVFAQDNTVALLTGVRIWATVVVGSPGNITLQAKASSTNTITISRDSIVRARLITGTL